MTLIDFNAIDDMPAGEQIDIAVAENIMGCKIIYKYRINDPSCGCDESHFSRPHNRNWNERVDCYLADYSANPIAASLVLKQMKERGFVLQDFWFRIDQWFAEFRTGIEEEGAISCAPDLPLAICRAALKTVRGLKDAA